MGQRSEIWITHPCCAFTWIAAHLPMEASKACRLLLDTRCPKCGEKKGILMATEAQIAAPGLAASPQRTICPHGVRDPRACHTCTPRESGFYVTGTA